MMLGTFFLYRKVNRRVHEQYLDLLEDVRRNGIKKGDRPGTGTFSVFGRQMKMNLNDVFPLLATKKVHLLSVFNEWHWFVSGCTNINDLNAKIWNEWATKEGELGPIYGKQWTAWPTKDGDTVNQIDYVVNTLKNNPNSRCILFQGWNNLPPKTLLVC